MGVAVGRLIFPSIPSQPDTTSVASATSPPTLEIVVSPPTATPVSLSNTPTANSSTATFTPELPTINTPTAVSSSLGKVLFEEDFEDGKVDGWLNVNDGEWSVYQNNGNTVYGVRDQPANFIPTTFLENSASWQDYSFETEVMFESGQLEQIYLIARTAKGADCTGYRFGGNRYGVSVFRFDPKTTCQGEVLAEVSNYPLVPNRLYKMRLEVEGTEIRTYIDNELIIAVEDSIYPRGGVALQAYEVKWAYFDNIRVATFRE
jgi:hypothetical protein